MPKRSSISITKQRIDALKPGQQIWDSTVVGFGVIANGNSKSYKLKYRYRSTQRMLTIGRHGSPWTVDGARKQAQAHLTVLHSGVDPAAFKVSLSYTVDALCAEYMEKHALVKKKPSSAQQDAANIKNHVRPLLGKLAVADVTAQHIDDFKIKVHMGHTASADPKAVQKAQRGGSPVKGGPGVTNRCLALLSKMFNLAEVWGYRPQNSNPTRGLSKFKEHANERYLSDEELKRLWEHLVTLSNDKRTDPFMVAFFKLLIVTGARKGEIQSLKWSMVDLVGKRLNLPDSKTGSKTIQLSDQAIAIFKGLPRVSDNPYVIAGAKAGKPLQNVRKPWIAIRKTVGLNDVRIHDIRHSFASFAVAKGTPLATIGKLLGHKNVGTTARYAHLSESYLAKENASINEHISGVITGTQEDGNPSSNPKADEKPRVLDTFIEL